VSIEVEPEVLAALLHRCGVHVPLSDRETLAEGLRELLRRFEFGEWP